MEISEFYLACCKGDIKDVKKFIENGQYLGDMNDRDHWNPLHCAALSGDMETIEFLFNICEYKQDKAGRTPLTIMERYTSYKADLLEKIIDKKNKKIKIFNRSATNLEFSNLQKHFLKLKMGVLIEKH